MMTSNDFKIIDDALESENPLQAIRSALPYVSVTHCSANDVIEDPYKDGRLYNLYLVNGNAGCWELTNDLEEATGIVLARKNK